jgi:hypothetical protein
MKFNRRTFVKSAALASGAAGLLNSGGCAHLTHSAWTYQDATMMGFRAPPVPDLRIGIIGLGRRGSSALRRLPCIERVTITALSDLFEERVARQSDSLKARGKPPAERYYGTPQRWRALCESDNVDLVYIATPWLLHTPMAVYAMQCGKHAAVEVPAAMTLEQCWQLVESSEAAGRHCMMLENCCYGEHEMMMLNMCRQGVLGQLVHGEAAYIHDLCKTKLSKDKHVDRWRLRWSVEHTGNPYPTHGLGPVCQYMNINRGDKMEYLSSISSDEFGLTRTACELFGEKSPEVRTGFKLGDMNTSIVKTLRGRTIMIQHNTTSPRPYNRLNMISGTKGIVADYPLRAALSPDTNQWMDEKELESLKKKYRHPLWDASGEAARRAGGHGGMDYMMDLRLCHCLQNGFPLDMDVYDAALWSSIVELSEKSVKRRGNSVTIPDFTRGGWKTAEPVEV